MLIKELVWKTPDELNIYPDNPRVGDREELAAVLRENGYAKVLIVQASTLYVLDGNHTHQCAHELGIEKFPCALIDVDDERAAKMVMAFNRLPDRGTYDPERMRIVAEIAGSAEGTGFSANDFTMLNEAIDQSNVDLIQTLIKPDVSIVQYSENDNYVTAQPESPEPPKDKKKKDKDDDDEDDAGELELADEHLKGSLDLKPPSKYTFESVGYWGIPALREDMLVTPDEVPADLKAWAGSSTRDWPDKDQWWVYNVGVDSTSGMHDITKVIVSFYTHDEYFENWWVYPERWVAKAVNSGITMAITPDFSQWADKPRLESLFNLYRNRWIGRYMQDAGIKVIPNVAWPYGDKQYFDEQVRTTLPDKLPVIAIQMQTFDRNQTDEELAELAELTKHVIRSCDAELTLFYTGFQGRELLAQMQQGKGALKKKVQTIPFRREMLDAQALKRRKKTTL